MNRPTIGILYGIPAERVTLTEAQKREAQADLERELYGRCPPLHTRQAAPNMRPFLWAVGIVAVIIAMSYAVSRWGWAVIVVGIIAALVIAWAAGMAVMVMEDEEQGASDERPEYDRE